MHLITTKMRRTAAFTATVAAVLAVTAFGMVPAFSDSAAAPYTVAHFNTK